MVSVCRRVFETNYRPVQQPEEPRGTAWNHKEPPGTAWNRTHLLGEHTVCDLWLWGHLPPVSRPE